MSTLITEYGNITPRTAAHAVKKLLERLLPLTVCERFGVGYQIPSKTSKVAKWRRYSSLAAATTPLAEGITPAGQRLAYTDVQVVMEQFGKQLPNQNFSWITGKSKHIAGVLYA